MAKILFTGFEAFSKWDVNPTTVAAEKLDGRTIGKHEVIGRVIPLRFKEIVPAITQHIDEISPSAIVMSGQAGGGKIRLERVAKNWAETSVPYNCGSKPSGEVLIEDAPQQLLSTLPLEKIYEYLKKENVPVKYSDSAGTFGCNQIFFEVVYRHKYVPAGFIHVPLLPEQVEGDGPSMDQATITKGLFGVLETVANELG